MRKSDDGEEDEGSVLDGISFGPWDLLWPLTENHEFNLGSNLKGVSVEDGAQNERIEDLDLGTCSIGF